MAVLGLLLTAAPAGAQRTPAGELSGSAVARDAAPETAATSLAVFANSAGDYDYGRQTTLPPGFGAGEFTLELWIKPDERYPVGPTPEDTPSQLVNWSDADEAPYSSSDWWFRGNFLLDGHNNGSGFQNGTFSLQFYGGGRVRWHFGDGVIAGPGGHWSVEAYPASSTPSLLDGNWHQVTLVRRWAGTTQADLELWMDGALVATETSSARTDMRTYWDTWDDFPAGQEGWFWGSEKQAAIGILPQYEDYKGPIDEVRFWSRAKSPTEIQDDWDKPVGGTEPGLAGVYHFEEAAGTTACDALDASRCIDLVNMKPGFWWPENAPFAPCFRSAPLVAGSWRQISLPCDVGITDTLHEVLGDDLDPADYGARWIVYEWDEVAGAHRQLALTDPVAEGRGYWLKTLDAGQSADAAGQPSAVLDLQLAAAPTGRFSMAGHPFTFAVCWADVTVVDGGSVLTLDQADPGGACQGPDPLGNGCVMSRVAYRWGGSAYESFDGQTPGVSGSLSPLDGFWVRAYKSGIALRIPAIAGVNCDGFGPVGESPAGAGEVDREAGWYVRLTATSGSLRDAANLLGQLATSTRGYDLHDLRELAPFAAPHLSVVFPHPDWADHAGTYTTDFHALPGTPRADHWTFEVRSSEVGQQVTLTWEGSSARLQRSRLIDDTLGRAVQPTPGGSYTFTLGPEPHRFRWILRGPAPPR